MNETFNQKLVTYTLENAGHFYIIENVPAKVCEETGEQLFAPSTVEQIRSLVLGHTKPVRVVETPVFKFVN